MKNPKLYIDQLTDIENFILSMIPVDYEQSNIHYYEKLDDNELFKASKDNLVDSIIGYRLMNEYGSDNISSNWVKAYEKVEREISLYLEELDRVADLFSKKNIRLIALKNSGIARAIYPYPGLVPMGDVDTLVKRSNFIDAHKILIENGYEIASPNKYHKADANIGYRTGGSEYKTTLSNGQQLWFELQWRPVEGRFLRPDQEPNGNELIDRSISIPGTKLRILSPDDNLLQVCLHTAKHSYVRAPGFRLHLDADRIINCQNVNWNSFIKNVIEHQVEIPTYFSLSIPKSIFGTEIPKEVIEKIKPGNIRKIILTNWIKKVGIMNPNKKKFGKISYIIWNMFLYDNLFGLIRSVFPKAKWLKNYYGFSNGFYLPYYYLKRIFELLFQRMQT